MLGLKRIRGLIVLSFLAPSRTQLLALVPPPRVSAFLRAGQPSGGRLLDRSTRVPRTKLAAESVGRNQVVILGGGFGGLYTALRLSQLNSEGSGR